MPDLAGLPSGERVFVDTNIFYLHFQARSATCTSFFSRVAGGDIVAYVNTEVLSDLIHKLMLAEACAKKVISKQSANLLKAHLASNRTCIAGLPSHQVQFEDALAIGIKVLSVTGKLLVETKIERVIHGLMTNDSLHVGNMTRCRPPLGNIATRDGDFGHIVGVTVWEPHDVIP